MNARQNMAVQGFYALDPWEYSTVLDAISLFLLRQSEEFNNVQRDQRLSLSRILDDAAQKARGKGF